MPDVVLELEFRDVAVVPVVVVVYVVPVVVVVEHVVVLVLVVE